MAQLLVLLLLVGSHAFADGADQIPQTGTDQDCPTCQSSTDDKVSLLTIKTKLTLGKEPDTASTNIEEELGKSCKNAWCNSAKCGGRQGTTGQYSTHATTKAGFPKEIESALCINAFGKDACCQETYDDGTQFGEIFLRQGKAANGASQDDVCNSCKPITSVGGPVNLYIMRHAEGCHNLKSTSKLSHPHKGKTGWRDAPLTTAGLEQAQLAQAPLRNLGVAFDRIVVSPMRRAQQTLSMAIQGTPLAGQDIKVTVFANEEGSPWYETNENRPTSSEFQECLFGKDHGQTQVANAKMGHEAAQVPQWATIGRCNAYVMRGEGDKTTLHTCSGKEYSTDAKMTSPQDFADFITAQYGGRFAGHTTNLLLGGHSNFAKNAGIIEGLDAEGHKIKVGWASIYKVTLHPGHDVTEDVRVSKQDPGYQVFAGTARNAGSDEKDQEEARCIDDVQWQTECKATANQEGTGTLQYKG